MKLNNQCIAIIFSNLSIEDLYKLYTYDKEYNRIIENYNLFSKYLTMNNNLIIHRKYFYYVEDGIQYTSERVPEVMKCIKEYQNKDISKLVLELYHDTKTLRNETFHLTDKMKYKYYSMVTIDNHFFKKSQKLIFSHNDYIRLINCIFYFENILSFKDCYNVSIKDVKINSPFKVKIINCTKVSIDNLYLCESELTIKCSKYFDKNDNEIVLNNVFINSIYSVRILRYNKVILTKCVFKGDLIIDDTAELYVDGILTNVNIFNEQTEQNAELDGQYQDTLNEINFKLNMKFDDNKYPDEFILFNDGIRNPDELKEELIDKYYCELLIDNELNDHDNYDDQIYDYWDDYYNGDEQNESEDEEN